MNILRTLDSIIDNIWGESLDGNCISNSSPPVPSSKEWNYLQDVDIKKIKLWEQLYHDPGNLGLFAAWSPYIECYILVYYPFLDCSDGIIIYYGNDACYDVTAVMKEISVNFEISKIKLPSVAI